MTATIKLEICSLALLLRLQGNVTNELRGNEILRNRLRNPHGSGRVNYASITDNALSRYDRSISTVVFYRLGQVFFIFHSYGTENFIRTRRILGIKLNAIHDVDVTAGSGCPVLLLTNPGHIVVIRRAASGKQ